MKLSQERFDRVDRRLRESIGEILDDCSQLINRSMPADISSQIRWAADLALALEMVHECGEIEEGEK